MARLLMIHRVDIRGHSSNLSCTPYGNMIYHGPPVSINKALTFPSGITAMEDLDMYHLIGISSSLQTAAIRPFQCLGSLF